MMETKVSGFISTGGESDQHYYNHTTHTVPKIVLLTVLGKGKQTPGNSKN